MIELITKKKTYSNKKFILNPALSLRSLKNEGPYSNIFTGNFYPSKRIEE